MFLITTKNPKGRLFLNSHPVLRALLSANCRYILLKIHNITCTIYIYLHSIILIFPFPTFDILEIECNKEKILEFKNRCFLN